MACSAHYYSAILDAGYLEDKCVGTTVDAILRKDKSITQNDSGGYLLESCCSSDPLITCYFKDKPNVGPCDDGGIMDKGRQPFW